MAKAFVPKAMYLYQGVRVREKVIFSVAPREKNLLSIMDTSTKMSTTGRISGGDRHVLLQPRAIEGSQLTSSEINKKKFVSSIPPCS